MSRALSYLLFFVVLFFYNSAFAVKIKRHCQAYYYGSVKNIIFSIDGVTKNTYIPPYSITVYFPDSRFSAEASCGKLVPNRCRKRARNKLLNCTRAHANSPNQLPQLCNPDLVKNYPGPDLRAMMHSRACGVLRSKDGINISGFLSHPYTLSLEVGVFVGGNTSCGVQKAGTTVDYYDDGTSPQPQTSGTKFKDYITKRLRNFSVTCP